MNLTEYGKYLFMIGYSLMIDYIGQYYYIVCEILISDLILIICYFVMFYTMSFLDSMEDLYYGIEQ